MMRPSPRPPGSGCTFTPCCSSHPSMWLCARELSQASSLGYHVNWSFWTTYYTGRDLHTEPVLYPHVHIPSCRQPDTAHWMLPRGREGGRTERERKGRRKGRDEGRPGGKKESKEGETDLTLRGRASIFDRWDGCKSFNSLLPQFPYNSQSNSMPSESEQSQGREGSNFINASFKDFSCPSDHKQNGDCLVPLKSVIRDLWGLLSIKHFDFYWFEDASHISFFIRLPFLQSFIL